MINRMGLCSSQQWPNMKETTSKKKEIHPRIGLISWDLSANHGASLVTRKEATTLASSQKYYVSNRFFDGFQRLTKLPVRYIIRTQRYRRINSLYKATKIVDVGTLYKKQNSLLYFGTMCVYTVSFSAVSHFPINPKIGIVEVKQTQCTFTNADTLSALPLSQGATTESVHKVDHDKLTSLVTAKTRRRCSSRAVFVHATSFLTLCTALGWLIDLLL